MMIGRIGLVLATLFCLPWGVAFATELPHYTGEITPRPQEQLGDWHRFAPDAEVVSIEVAQPNEKASQLAERLLRQRLGETTREAEASDARPLKLVVGTFEDALVREALADHSEVLDLVLRPEGYAIRVIRGDDEDMVVGVGEGLRGMFYAAATLIQMMGVEDGRPILKMTDLNDWPHWRQRYVSERGARGSDRLLLQALYKINGFAVQLRTEWWDFDEDAPPANSPGFSTWREALASMHELSEDAGLIDTMLMLNLYTGSPRKRPLLDIADEGHIESLIRRLRFAASMGIGHIMILADDWTPIENGEYVLPGKAERERFGRNAGAGHGYLMKRIHQALKVEYPDLSLSFCPAPYALEHVRRHNDPGPQKRYLRDLARVLPEEVAIVWTGPRIESLSVSRQDFLDYSELVLNHRTFLWDNVSAVRENNPRMPALITRFYDGFEADSQGTMYLNTFMYSRPWYQALGVTANDYYWNPTDFDTQASHEQTVNKLFGPGAYEWVERYYELDPKATELARHDPEAAEAVFDALRELFAELSDAGVNTAFLERQLRRQIGIAQAQADKPTVSVPRFDSPPTIDGRLDDPQWEHAGELSAFHPYREGTSVDPTEGLIAYDDKALYLGFRATHSQPLETPVGAARRDAPIYALSDAIEIILSPDVDGRPLGQLIVDHVENRFDQSPQAGGTRWNPEWELATYKGDGWWSVEVRIPFDSVVPPFESAPTSGTVWYGNFCRSNATADEASSWAPAHGGGFQNAAFFGEIRFE